MITLTPEEKAQELVIKMYQPLPSSKEAEKGKEHLYYNQYNAAKQCALIAQRNLLQKLKDLNIYDLFEEEVYKEIEKL